MIYECCRQSAMGCYGEKSVCYDVLGDEFADRFGTDLFRHPRVGVLSTYRDKALRLIFPSRSTMVALSGVVFSAALVFVALPGMYPGSF